MLTLTCVDVGLLAFGPAGAGAAGGAGTPGRARRPAPQAQVSSAAEITDWRAGAGAYAFG